MAGGNRTDKLTGFEALGLLTGTRRGGDWSGPLPEISGLSVDSRETRPGHLFAALPGSRMHGADFIPYAIRMGASAILTDPEGLGEAFAKAQAMAAEFRVPVVVEVILERVTNIAMGVEITGVNEFEDLAISAEDAPTATALLD